MTEIAGPAPAVKLLQTPLIEFHRAHGGHLVPFAGWEMPLYYSGIIAEHTAVRSGAGLFDVGHMGILTVTGGTAAALLSRRTTINVEKIAPGQVKYGFFLQMGGGIVDDLLITRLDAGTGPTSSYLVVPNAGRAFEIQLILQQHRHPDATIERWNGRVTILAVQGPKSRTLLEKEFGWSLAGLGFYRSRFFPAERGGPGANDGTIGGAIPGDLEHRILVSRTGYTGELGYELFLRGDRARAVADRLVQGGALPCGLGARDTLRLEKGYLLSGQEFLRNRSPIQAGQDRFVEFDHPFVGRETLEAEQKEGPAERLVGLRVNSEGAVPRHGTPVHRAGQPIGTVTSGGLSPNLHVGIALAYLPKEYTQPGTQVELELRGREVPAEVVPLPFLPATKAPA
ncbi:MAG TPA: glycine cleavage system aminomethyltransferase GcvT [Thermoplasmata archaeon]|nr:glycine cleavage system aminomethyltransferase GcvT [Thermoplasmata archaeon]